MIEFMEMLKLDPVSAALLIGVLHEVKKLTAKTQEIDHRLWKLETNNARSR